MSLTSARAQSSRPWMGSAAELSPGSADQNPTPQSQISGSVELEAAKQNHGFDGLPNNQKIHAH